MWDFTQGTNPDDEDDEPRPRPPVDARPEGESDAAMMFSLPDLPAREGDLRPVDPIRAFDEEFATTPPRRLQPLFGDPEPEPEPEPEPVIEVVPDPEPEPEPEPQLLEPQEPRSMDWGEKDAAPEPAPGPEPEAATDEDEEHDSRFYEYSLERTYEPTPPAERFIGMLGELPATISVFSPIGGVAYLEITGLDHLGHVTAYGPDEFMEPGFEITAELRDEHGGGFDITLEVVESYFQAGNRGLLHLTVTDVVERVGERETPRLPVSELAEASVVFSAVLPERFTMGVRVADVSARGLALLTEKTPAVGDTLTVNAVVGGRNIVCRVRVTRIDPAAFGRYRLGCEITRIGAADREYLGEIAASARSGTPDQRRPDKADVLKESRAEQGSLKERFGR